MRSQEIRRRQMGQDSMGRGDRPGDMMGRQVIFLHMTILDLFGSL